MTGRENENSVDTGNHTNKKYDEDSVKECFVVESADKQETPQEQGCGRLAISKEYRCKLLHTICNTWAMTSSGMSQTMMGLAFPDLMLIIDQDLAKSSWIFTAWSFGNMVGSLLAGFTYDRLNKLGVLVSLSIGLAIALGTIPRSANFPVMLLIHLIGGGFASAIHSTVTADTMLLWKHEKGTYLQIVHLAATAGGILSPFAVKPFLAKRRDEIAMDTNVTSDSPVESVSSSTLISDHDTNNSLYSVEAEMSYGTTTIQYAYLLAAGFTLIAVFLYGLVRVTHGNVYLMDIRDKKTNEEAHTEIGTALSKKVTTVLVIIVSVQIMIYVTMQRHVFGLFMTYAINELDWSKNKTSNALAFFWCSFCFGRVTAVLAIRKWREKNLNRFYLLTATVGVIGFVVSSLTRYSVLIIVFLIISAYGMSPLFTYMFSWFSSHVTLVTGQITGIVYVFMAIGSMTVPVISGYLMKSVSYQWFLYLLIILIIAYLSLTLIIRLIYRNYVNRAIKL